MPDELDSYRFDGEVLDYVKDDGYSLTVSVDGQTTTLEELANGTNDGSDGSDTTDDTTTTTDDTTTTTTTTTTEDNTTTTTTEDTTTDDGSTDSPTDDSLPNTITLDGRDDGDVTTYTFTVSGDVARDPDASVETTDGTPWSDVEDIARDGQVLGLVASGADVFQFSGHVTNITVDGDAAVSIQRS
jgi:hypothetical protein